MTTTSPNHLAQSDGARPDPHHADAVRALVDEQSQDLLEHLIGWVRIRSVSGNPDDAAQMMRSANWLASLLRETGFPDVQIWSTPGSPAVFASWCEAPGAPTVLVYSHHDVQACKDDNWFQTPPFEPTLREGRLYGRGTSDAKGQVLAHVWGLRTHLAATGRSAPAVNLLLLVEGDEEMSSPHLAQVLADHRDVVDPGRIDLVMISDTSIWSSERPAVCTGVRGLITAELEVYGAEHDAHSGAVSGPAPNSALELCRLLGALHDDDGRITLPGFYDAVAEPSPAEREHLRSLPHDPEEWVARTGTRSVGGEAGWSLPEQLYVRPSAEVTALIAGDPIGPARGAIPAVATASLGISTVPDQTVAAVADQLRAWVADRISDRFACEVSVSEELGQEPYATPEDLPALDVLEQAVVRGFGVPPEQVGRMRNAGGDPAQLLSTSLDAPVIFFGTGLPEDNWHDSDESVLVDVLLSGVATLAHLWPLLAEHHAAS